MHIESKHSSSSCWASLTASPACNKVIRWGAGFFVLLSMATLASSWVVSAPPALNPSLFRLSLRIGGGVGIGVGALVWLFLPRAAHRPLVKKEAGNQEKERGFEIHSKKIYSDDGMRHTWNRAILAARKGHTAHFHTWLVFNYDNQQVCNISSKKDKPSSDNNKFAFFVRITCSPTGDYLQFLEGSPQDSIVLPVNTREHNEISLENAEELQVKIQPVREAIRQSLAV